MAKPKIGCCLSRVMATPTVFDKERHKAKAATGEPDAGDPPVRFGGRGSREALPTL